MLLRSHRRGHGSFGCCKLGFGLGLPTPKTAATDLAFKLGFLTLKLLHPQKELLHISELAG